ncbi:MAG: hypothetical protein C4519_17855 [Desulfobacteraceae bacterium]|nr:MAG: hypothetical protein C4519_17855 [Desulfobacteraceae bacterium]
MLHQEAKRQKQKALHSGDAGIDYCRITKTLSTVVLSVSLLPAAGHPFAWPPAVDAPTESLGVAPIPCRAAAAQDLRPANLRPFGAQLGTGTGIVGG